MYVYVYVCVCVCVCVSSAWYDDTQVILLPRSIRTLFIRRRVTVFCGYPRNGIPVDCRWREKKKLGEKGMASQMLRNYVGKGGKQMRQNRWEAMDEEGPMWREREGKQEKKSKKLLIS